MNSSPKLVSSLTITVIMGFLAPVIVCGSVFACCTIFAILPGVAIAAQFVREALQQFLIIFGSGQPWVGILIIATACSLVGGAFEVFNFYSYQKSDY